MNLINYLLVCSFNVIMPDGPVDTSGTYGGAGDSLFNILGDLFREYPFTFILFLILLITILAFFINRTKNKRSIAT